MNLEVESDLIMTGSNYLYSRINCFLRKLQNHLKAILKIQINDVLNY